MPRAGAASGGPARRILRATLRFTRLGSVSPPGTLRRVAALAAVLVIGAAAPPLAHAAGEEAPRAWVDVLGASRGGVATGERLIVVLKVQPAALRPRGEGRLARFRAAQADVAAAERALVKAVPGLVVRDRLARVVAALVVDAPAAGVRDLVADPRVADVVPVRAVVATGAVATALPVLGAAARPLVADLDPGDARPVVALLDGPVEVAHPYLAGRVTAPGQKPLADAAGAAHGTAMAGIVTGQGGPDGLRGSAPGVRVVALPALEPDAAGRLRGSTATLLAALDRAADLDGDGDLGDRARIVLAPLGARYAAGVDGVEARAVAALERIGSVVVVAAGNDGATGGALGSVSALAALPDVLAVGALDGRSALPRVAIEIDGAAGEAVLGGALAPAAGLRAPLRRIEAKEDGDPFRSLGGGSLVQGAVPLVQRRGRSLRELAVLAARAGAPALAVWGEDALPAGGLGADDLAPIPVVGLASDAATAIDTALAAGREATIAFGAAAALPNPQAGLVAPFSSGGPGPDGAVRPDLVLPGVAITSARPGGGYGAVSGTSAAAAQAAGLLAQLAARHIDWTPARLRSALARTATPVKRPDGALEPVARQGSGLPSPAAADAAPVVVGTPPVLGPLRADGTTRRGALELVNPGAEPVTVRLSYLPDGSDPGVALALDAEPATFAIAPGAAARVPVRLRVASGVASQPVLGGELVVDVGGVLLHVPLATGPAAVELPLAGQPEPERRTLGGAPVGVVLPLGGLRADGGRVEIRPLASARLLLVPRGGRARVLWAGRDLLPGRYGVLIDRPAGVPAGRARLVLEATAADGRTTTRRIGIRIGG